MIYAVLQMRRWILASPNQSIFLERLKCWGSLCTSLNQKCLCNWRFYSSRAQLVLINPLYYGYPLRRILLHVTKRCMSAGTLLCDHLILTAVVRKFIDSRAFHFMQQRFLFRYVTTWSINKPSEPKFSLESKSNTTMGNTGRVRHSN